LPALRSHSAALCREGSAAAFQHKGSFLILIRLAYGAQKPRGSQGENVALPRGKGGKIGACRFFGRQNRVVVADLAPIHYLGGVDGNGKGAGKGERPGYLLA